MKVALKRTAIATSTVACVALLSLSWSEQRGVSLGVESAQARIDRPSLEHHRCRDEAEAKAPGPTRLAAASANRRMQQRAAMSHGVASNALVRRSLTENGREPTRPEYGACGYL